MHAATRLDLRNSRVLLVDDNPQSLEITSHILLGFRVGSTIACGSASEAREKLAALAFDLVLIDGEMPQEDGISLTHSIRREPKQPNQATSIILLCGHTPQDKVIRARDAGANMIIKKPVAPSVLLARIAWLARNTREFVSTATYFGPDRRFKSVLLPDGIEERRADAIALVAEPERALSQNEVDSIFD
jgi:DNA-binding response OmpR family regulator